MEDMDDDGDMQADALTSLEYTNLEGVHMDVISNQVQAQASIDYSEVGNDNDDDLANLERVAQDVTQSVNGNDNEPPENIRGVTQDTLLHSESISYDVLCALAGTTNLGGVRNFTIRLRCPGPQDSIRRLPRLMPFLTSLYLDNSSFVNFRVFGEETSSLKVLSVCSCGINELHGLDFLVNLRELYAACNAISNVLDLTDLHKLTIVDLENNDVSTFDSVSFLFLSARLHTVTFRGNPIAQDPTYQDKMKQYLPRLRALDPMPRKYRVVDEDCNPPKAETESPEDDEFADMQIKVPEPEQMSEDESISPLPTPVVRDENAAAEIFDKFKEQEAVFDDEVEDQSLFVDIEDEEDQRNTRKESAPEQMLESPDESFEMEEIDDASCSSASITHENLIPDPSEEQQEETPDKKFCCKKHRQLFTQSSSSIRLCATKQLYEQVSCDEPDNNIETEEERDKKLWEKPQSNKIQGSRNRTEKIDYNAHEADITGKLLSKRQSMNPAKVKGVMIETNEQDIEEISSKALPAVSKEPKIINLKSAFIQNSISSENDEEYPAFGETQFTHFPTQRSRPGSSNQLFKQGKGRPPSATSSKNSSSTRPSSSSSFGSIGEVGAMSGNDSGVEIPASPGKESIKPSFGSLPKVKTKDDLLKMLQGIRTEPKSPEMEIEDWN